MPESRISLVDEGGEINEAVGEILRSLSDNPSEAQTLLVGSGLSIWEPSDLASGQDFTKAAFTILFGDEPALSAPERLLLEKAFGKRWSPKFSGMPFEHLMECCPSEEKATALINRVYDSRRPNPLHHALAEGMKHGKIGALITTNYDCCIDEALEQAGTRFVKVVTPEQARDALMTENVPRYFKIHGSVEKGMESTPMFSLRHEGLLQRHKRDLFSKLLSGRRLLVIGYSGLDFELCPEIERLDVAQLVWNNREDEYPSVSAERLIRKKGGILLYGDMRTLITAWLGTPGRPQLTTDKSGDVERVIRQTFTEEELGLWRIKVLNSLGMPSFALRALPQSGLAVDPYFARLHYGRAHFHAGRYKTARRWFLRAFWHQIVRGKKQAAADAALETSDAYRSFGAPVRAYLATLTIDLFNVRSLGAKKLLKQALVIKDVMILLRGLMSLSDRGMGLGLLASPSNRLITALENLLRAKLVRCATQALETGNWIDFQQVALVSEELGIDLPDAGSGDHYLPPKSAEGYRHLGYYIPQTMVFVADCLRDRGRLQTNAAARREWRHHVKTCKRLGVNSSLWKILAQRDSDKIRYAARELFELCEYGYFKGFFDWKKYSIRK